jgi:F0F1-type ATP synthase membrane subunit b/b'
MARIFVDVRGRDFKPIFEEATVAVTKDVPGLCERFEETCEAAEVTRVQAVEKATKERNHFVSSISRGRVEPSERLKTALEARRERKVKAAQEEYEAACGRAEEELMKALDGLMVQ